MIKNTIIIYINLLFFIQEDYLNITSLKTKYTPIVNIKKKKNNVSTMKQRCTIGTIFDHL